VLKPPGDMAMNKFDFEPKLDNTLFSLVNPLGMLWTIGSTKYVKGKLVEMDLFGYCFDKTHDPRGTRENGRVITLKAKDFQNMTDKFWSSAYYRELNNIGGI
jgi:hypothetical protein